MSEETHTPGPWRMDEHGNVVTHWSERMEVIVDGEKRTHQTGLLALVYGCADRPDGHYRPSSLAANARLLAAAPELLDAVIKIRADTYDQPTNDELDALIAKARGSSAGTETQR